MLLLILLLPLVAAAPLKVSRKGYILDIDNGTLENVQYAGDAIPELDLSNLQIRRLEKYALDNVLNLTSLSLANNSLESLPEFIFSNLTNLRYLSLAENMLLDLKNLFVGLGNLETLNISCNPVMHLRHSHLFGLTKATTILTEGNKLWSISMVAFTNSFVRTEDELEKLKAEVDAKQRSVEVDNIIDIPTDNPSLKTEWINPNPVFMKVQHLKLCMPNQIVLSLESLDEGKNVSNGCLKLSINEKERTVSLRNLGIRGFQEGWYQLQNLPIVSLDLALNEIAEITTEVLNELPEGLIYVNLMENKIKSIWSQVIENKYLKMLNLKNNLIDSIEEGALQKTNLSTLFLNGNQLYNLSFVSSLPQTLTEFILASNQIASITDHAFTNLPRLVYLNIANNKISKLQNNVFKGLDSLQVLIMTRNSLIEIEREAFTNLQRLTTLYLYRNSLRTLQKGTFSGLTSLKELNLAWNKFETITQETFADLPRALDDLILDFNEINSVEKASFVNVPRFTLSLNGNKISSILPGTFDLPILQNLHLANNNLTTINSDSYTGLPQLNRLWLNANQIQQIPKGSCKNLGSLHILDISENPFEKLENGALYGLNLAKGKFVHIYYNHLKELQGGVFNDS